MRRLDRDCLTPREELNYLRERNEHLEYVVEELTTPPPGWVMASAGEGLTKYEARLVGCLMRAKRPVSKDVLITAMSYDGNESDGETLRPTISRVRRKIGRENIRTVRGYGYQWEEPK